MSLNSYNKWIDYIKFTCIFSIILIHSKAQVSAYLIHLTLATFFFLAGLLFNPDRYPTLWLFFKHRAKQLLIPYFFFFIIIYSLWLLGRDVLSDKSEVPFYLPVLEYLYGKPRLLCWPLWFIPCLFTMQCIFYLLYSFIKNRIILICISISLSMLSIVLDFSKFPFTFNDVCIYIPFYAIAFLYKNKLFSVLSKRKYYFAGILCILFFFFIENLYITLENSALIRSIGIIGNLILIILFSVFSNTINLSINIDKLVCYIANNTIIILVLHNYFLKVFYLIFKKISPLTYSIISDNFLFNFCLSLTTLLSLLIPIYLINKYTPFILGKGHYFNKI